VKAGRCQCHAGKPHHRPGECLNALGEPKNFMCRPCAKGWHQAAPCGAYRPERFRHLMKTCVNCGFDSAVHPIPVGSFG
jgi:hypothetical protein